MRTRLYDDLEEYKERKVVSQHSSDVDTRARKSEVVGVDEGKTKVLASLVPDEIVFDCNDYSDRPYDVCLLFGDVSGELFWFLRQKIVASNHCLRRRWTHFFVNVLYALCMYFDLNEVYFCYVQEKKV